ncbi:MAG TPA: MASE1 domain-containing protein [Gemmatimonadales bacterium]|nr:MASE1 domain-containing protein [Gemmatimonadales bacterium]
MGAAVRYVSGLLLLAAVYYGAARFGLRYASVGQSVSLIWPPTGIAFATLTVLGYRYWPGVAAGAFLANAATPIPLAAAAGIALGNTLEAVCATYVLRRAARGAPDLDHLADVQALVLVAAPIGALVSAAIGVGSLVTTGALPTAAAQGAAGVWWAGDLLGALVVAPVLLAWAKRPPVPDTAARVLEITGLCLATALAAELVLGQLFRQPILRRIDYPYLLFPFVIWGALRFGARGASLLTLTVAIVAVWHTVEGGGPFIAASAPETLIAVAVYLAAAATTGLVLAAAVQRERGQATTTIRQSEERLRLALDSARMGIWFWSVDTNVLVWDDRLRQLYGLRADERISGYDEFLRRVHPDDRDLVSEAVRRALQEGGSLDYEFRIQLPDGSVRWITDQGQVGRDASGRPIYMTGVCMDTTVRRQTEEGLRQAHRMESVGRLAGGVAHEANNQMTVVLGAARLILDRPDLPEPIRADVEYIRKAADRTAAVTAQLLAFSRRQLLKPEILELDGVVSAWEPVLRRVMDEDCEVILRLGAEGGRIKADPGQLEQVLLNLALNARDAMPAGGSLTLETARVEFTPAYARLKTGIPIRPGWYAMLAVSDTGHGMNAATASHIFEPFFTTKETGRGTGLGLSTVYGIVKQSDGYVWAYSEPQQGSTFKVYLPLTDDVAAAIEEPVLETPRATGERVLLVEDEARVREIARRALEDAGYRVMEAGNGREALELMGRSPEPLALVLTDVVLPGMSGPDLARRVTEVAPGTPVLLTSGYPDREIDRRGLLTEGAAFIQKPFTPEALVRMVRQTIAGAHRAPRGEG